MSNISKQNQNAKQSGVGSQITWGVAGNYIYDNIVKGGLPTMIALYTTVTVYLRGVDWFWIVIYSVIVFFVVAVSLNLIDLWRKTKTNGVLNEDATSPITDSQENSDTNKALKLETNHRNDLESLKTERQAEIESQKNSFHQTLANLKRNHDHDIRMREVLLDEVGFAIATIREQKENINDYVILEDIWCFDYNIKYKIPSITFQLDIHNVSVYELAVEEKLIGEIRLKNESFRGEKTILEPPQHIRSNNKASFLIEQRVSDLEIEFIKKARIDFETKRNINDPVFEFDKLGFSVKGSKKFPNIVAKTIMLSHKLNVRLESIFHLIDV